MRRLMVMEAPLVRPDRGFACRQALAERLAGECLEGFHRLDSPLPLERAGILRKLALLCLFRFEEPHFDPAPTISLLEHHARFSPEEEVRRGCIDSLTLLGQRALLESLTFEPGSEGSRLYRDQLLERLFQPR